MKILILETSTEKGCLIWTEGNVPIRVSRLAGTKNLALEVKNLLNGQVPDLVAVGTGPGSYTGIRVGAALAKALAYGWKVPLIGFCSLAAFGPHPVLVDARMGGFYALLEKTPSLISPTDPRLQNIPHIASPHPDLIKKRLNTGALFHETEPDAELLAKLCFHRFQQGESTPLELTYLSCP